MVIFLIGLFPLSYWGLQYLFDNQNVRLSDRILPFFYGFFTAVPVILVQWSMDIYFPLTWTLPGKYMYAFFNSEGILLYPFLVLLFLVFRKKIYKGIPLREMTAWFCGFYFTVVLCEALILRGAMTPYDALVLPLYRLFNVFFFSALAVMMLHIEDKNRKIASTLVYFLMPLILNFITILELSGISLVFGSLFIIYGGASIFLYYMVSRGRYL